MHDKKIQTIFKLACLGTAAFVGNATSGCIGPAESYIVPGGETKTQFVPIPIFLPMPFFHHHHHHRHHGSVTKPADVIENGDKIAKTDVSDILLAAKANRGARG